ncbi:ribonuclease Y [candidate division WOR-1 bacterium RIFOXYA12_FULL_43_27]|uniref:Ribonuclease Y n=1 Tax=candidate division WOR-1 bacterium RIFOXYC2_FULL_46_14 TaxID=1802587 RepID=A0A1F4U4I0_UNCSA|nr:MAG: ribonuclease Y [candidate division WOR-1 bacterium RIFOXYA12_FULL_43_27]OGC20823.1 MAG: ribonuclease Y [candidate division WOR-1 bacterium RIFOXYB2_FULL_46_45]OGC31440.1 MAG: ribonuclease Y [candidate division WOR-1 bacterium RIFOXYA2_FULL_46_56]OGC39846.1 MAG: ribonuclease Y [candidate division WOR-1 bacterium RIFOXYC2_FULL_46_14]
MSIEIFLSVIILSSVVFGLAVVYLIVRKQLAGKNLKIAEESAKRILDDAKREAETKRKELIIEAKEEKVKMLKDAETEARRTERRLEQKEENIEKKDSAVTEREKKIEAQENKLKEKSDSLDLMKAELEKLRTQETEKLEKVAQLSREEAKKLLLDNVEKSSRQEAGAILRKVEEETKKEAEKKSREILATAIQRCAVDHVVETTTSLVELPSDDMKGRIIGKEGRNIRAFETLTGVDLVVDDTPEAVILSSFDPLRREIAKRTLNKLIVDGRIHPARVEEMYNKAKEEAKAAMWEHGEQAAFDADVQGLPAVLIQLLGRLHFRTSYGQNVLQHSKEVSYLAGMLAAELGVNVKLAKRGGLLHDIGKAIDQEAEGTHTKLGALFAQKAGESPEVVHCIESHHHDIEPSTIEAILVEVSDAISASRPGARRDTLEAYVKRLQNLENVVKTFDGVERCFAIQAGREVRVVVQPDKINDDAAAKLAHDIAKKIESELEYPGEVKVTVIRETRSHGVAK